jgi:serine/threonine protein kinase
MDDLRPEDPRQIGPYWLEGRLGSGGMGDVYLGRSPGGRHVAIKVIRAELARDAEFRGLVAIHAAGLVHRDLKPSNVLLAEDGPRLIDFGISRSMDSSALTRTGMVMGSPGFMSPEQARGHEVGPPSDIFSLGAVLAFAATGKEPFGSGSGEVLLDRISPPRWRMPPPGKRQRRRPPYRQGPPRRRSLPPDGSRAAFPCRSRALSLRRSSALSLGRGRALSPRRSGGVAGAGG